MRSKESASLLTPHSLLLTGMQRAGSSGAGGWACGPARPQVSVLSAHLIMDDRVPGPVTVGLRDIVFPSPAAKPQLFNKVNLSHWRGGHNNPFPFWAGREAKVVT